MKYTPPAKHELVFALTNLTCVMQGGNLEDSIQTAVTLLPDNTVLARSQTNKLRVALVTSRGTFSGSFSVPPSKLKHKFNGVLIRQLNAGYGYFVGTNQSGFVRLGPASP